MTANTRFFLLAIASLISLSGISAAQQNDTAPSLDEFVAPSTDEAARPDPEQMARSAAFKQALEGSMPLSPDQVRGLIDRMSEMQRSSATALADPVRPKAELKVETISLDPGVAPPVIRVAAGYVTTVMMMDASGAPWEVADLAYAGRVDVKTTPAGPHVIRITPLNRFYEGNVTVQLRGLATPLTFALSASNDVVYYRYDVRVPAMGPNARPPRFAAANTMVAGDSVMTAVLDGYPPSGARRLKVQGLDDRSGAWDVNGQIYLRTPHSLLSPAWSSSTSSGDGTTVYAIPDTPVLLLSDQGIMVRARVTRPEGIMSGETP